MYYFVACKEVLGSVDRCSELFEGQSSQKRLESLLKELTSMGLEQKYFFTGLVRGPIISNYYPHLILVFLNVLPMAG